MQLSQQSTLSLDQQQTYSIQDIMKREDLQEYVFKTQMRRSSKKFMYVKVKV